MMRATFLASVAQTRFDRSEKGAFARFMKLTKLLLTLLLAAIGFSATASAAIIVHKGSGSRIRGNAAAGATETLTIFYVIDTNTSQNRLIFVSPKFKTVFDSGTRFYGLISARTSTSVKQTLFITAGNAAFASTNNFNNYYVRFKGLPTTLGLLPNHAQDIQFPRTLAGTIADIDGLLVFLINSTTLSFDQKHTFQANNPSLPLSTLGISAVIRGEYTAKGYADTTP